MQLVTKLNPILEDGHVERQFTIVSGGTGLTRTIRGGFFVRGSIVNTIAQADVTVTDDDVTYICINTNTNVIDSALTIPSEDNIMLFDITAASGVVTTINDWRHRTHGLIDIT